MLIRKKIRYDEEFVNFYDIPDITKPITSQGEKLEIQSLNVEQFKDFLNLFYDKDIKQKLLDLLFPNQIHSDISKKIKEMQEFYFFGNNSNEENKTNSHVEIEQNALKLFKDHLKNDLKTKNLMEVLSTNRSKRLVDREIGEFIKINRRLTLLICNKILEMGNDCYYCGVAKLPGIWLASSIRRNKSHHLVDVENLRGEIYNRQRHLIDSCTRQLLRNPFTNFLGENNYSVTLYEDENRGINLGRLSLDVENYMVCIDMTKELILKSFPTEVDLINKLKDDMKKFLILIPNPLDEVHFKNKNKQYKTGQFYKDDLDRNFEDILEKYPEVRYASFTTLLGMPLTRYEKEKIELLIKGPDELVNLAETCVRQLNRANIAEFFGPVNFTMTEYETITKFTVPIYLTENKKIPDYVLIFSKNGLPKISTEVGKIIRYLRGKNIEKIFAAIDTF